MSVNALLAFCRTVQCGERTKSHQFLSGSKRQELLT